MASSRLEKSLKNAGLGMITQVLTAVLNFIARVEFVKVLGGAANGLNGLFVEVVAAISLAELGIGTAITYSLYKPLATGDEEKISRIMGLFKTAYRIIALAILLIGLIVSPFIKYLVTGVDFSEEYIRRIFILFVIRAASTYFAGYKIPLIIADQKSYIVSITTTTVRAFCTVTCVSVLHFFKSFELFLIVQITFNLVINLCLTIYSRRHYPYIGRFSGVPAEERRKIFSNIKNVFIGRLSGRITHSTDNILISVLVGTVSTGIYSNYSLIISNVKQVTAQMMDSITGSFGNMFVLDSNEHCADTVNNADFVFYALGILLGGGLAAASTPFVQLFFGEKFLLDPLTLYVCAFNLFLATWTLPLWNIMNTAGLFKYDKWVSIAGSVINLVVSFILGKAMGMVGIFIGTVITYTVQILLKTYVLYRKRFEMPVKARIFRSVWMYAAAAIVIYAHQKLLGFAGISSLLLRFFVSGVASALMTAVIITALFGRKREFRYFLGVFRRILNRKEAIGSEK